MRSFLLFAILLRHLDLAQPPRCAEVQRTALPAFVPAFTCVSLARLRARWAGGRQIADSLLALVVEKDLEQPTAGSLASKAGAASHAPEPQNSHKTRRDCWQSTFSPQMNSNMKVRRPWLPGPG